MYALGQYKSLCGKFVLVMQTLELMCITVQYVILCMLQ